MCPICKCETREVFQKNDHWILECVTCGHRCAEITRRDDHIERVYGATYFEGGKAGYPNYLAFKDNLVFYGRRYAKLLERFMEPGTIFDVGTAAGFILRGFEESGWIGSGIEPNPQMAEYARDILGLDVETGSLEKLKRDERYDLISMIQVIAHFIDPREALQVAARITGSRGFWLIETWNRESRIARIMGRSWHEYSPPSVLHWFTLEGLGRLVSQFGFEEVARGRPFKRIDAKHLKSILKNGLDGSTVGRFVAWVLSLVPNGFSFPYPGDDIFWVLYRRNESAYRDLGQLSCEA